MGAPAIRSKRLAVAAAGALAAVGFVAASAPSQSALLQPEAEIQLVTAGPGRLTISPAEDGQEANCKVDVQVYEPGSDETCIQHYEPGTRVTLEAVPDDGHSFAGWSDFECAMKSRSCTLTLAAGTRYVTARFSPVTLKISHGEGNFGSITVRPKPRKTCTFDYDNPCEYAFGTTVTLSRSRSAPGYFWVGACDDNRKGVLDAAVCRLRLESNELVGAGYREAGEIPPPLGSGIVVALGGSGRGKVTGRVVNDNRTLNCGTRCSISGLDRNDHVLLRAVSSRGSHFYRWSDFSRLRTRIVSLSSTTRIRASFVKN
ncbi:MAG: hypothetical protein M3292_01455 [Actinomycetota bacterium]|nr:hypothetical protein [Actinomycetota bacterium]